MTGTLHSAPTGTPLPPAFPPVLPAGPGRVAVVGSAAALVVALGAAVLAGVTVMTPSKPPVNTVVAPWSPPEPSSDQAAAARTKACQVWGGAASAIDDAANAVTRAPADWNAPAMQDALTNEARVTLVESAYLRRELPAETPATIRSGIDDYLAANIDKENATTHRRGTARDAAIDRVNAAEGKVNAACQ